MQQVKRLWVKPGLRGAGEGDEWIKTETGRSRDLFPEMPGTAPLQPWVVVGS